MPQHYKYLVVGGGMTADAAVHGIREVDAAGSIGLFSMEVDSPYDRPPLTKGLWKDASQESVWRHTQKERVEFHSERAVETVELPNKRVRDIQKNVVERRVISDSVTTSDYGGVAARQPVY